MKPSGFRSFGWPFAILLLTLGVVLIPYAFGGSVRFERGVELTRVEVPRQGAPGSELEVHLFFEPRAPIEGNWWIFSHIESHEGDDNCRVVRDLRPTPPTEQWGEGPVEHTIAFTLPAECNPGKLQVMVGIYNRTGLERLMVENPRTLDNRLRVGEIQIVESDPDTSVVTLTGTSIVRTQFWALISPWRYWVLAILAVSFFAAWLHSTQKELVPGGHRGSDKRASDTSSSEPAETHPSESDKDEPADSDVSGSEEEAATHSGSDERDDSRDEDRRQENAYRPVEDPRVPSWARRYAFAVPVVLFLFGTLVVLEFVKDDAYISFRYAHNFVIGDGLVFNHGEYLEGFTNFLWTMIMVPFEAIGWDVFQVSEVIGTILTLNLLWLTVKMARFLYGTRGDLSDYWPTMWLAASGSLVVYSKSGLEQPLSTLLPFLTAWLVWHIGDANDQRETWKRAIVAGVVGSLGCMTRPEVHLPVAILGVPLLIDSIRARRPLAPMMGYAAAVLAMMIPFHAFRYAYFGDLLPNTYYVKTGTGDLIWRAGLDMVREMFWFNGTGVLVLLVPFAFLNRERRLEKIVMAIIAGAFLFYMIRVGADEMHWYRLYLPALPFLVLLAATGLRNLMTRLAQTRLPVIGRSALMASALGWVVVLVAVGINSANTWREYGGLNGYADLTGMYHPDMGKFVVRHDRPGALVAFQDMGSTPYHAPDIAWLDFIGLVEGRIAHARHQYGLHAFVAQGESDAQRRFDAEMRDYFFERNPEWAILTVYTPDHLQDRIAELFAANPGPDAMLDTYAENHYQIGIWRDQRFRNNYVHVRTWPRSRGYYLSMFRRRDLWEQTPGEVVLDEVPEGIDGPTARFVMPNGVGGAERNTVELLGAEIEAEVVERREAFMTTWWRVPGPLPEDVMFFVHVVQPNFQAPGDHVPGDSMYPANRWQPGQILEDRILFQLPIGMEPGEYEVYIGVYRRSTGERFQVVSGPNDGDNRVRIGAFRVRPMIPFYHHLIRPTVLDEMRKYPDRIIPHGRTEYLRGE